MHSTVVQQRCALVCRCVIDFVPREFDAECCNILANFAEMVVRETERCTGAYEEQQVRPPPWAYACPCAGSQSWMHPQWQDSLSCLSA